MQELHSQFDQKHLILIGAGHANIQVIRKLWMNPVSGLRTSLVSRDFFTPYSGMLPGHLLGYYRFEESHFDLSKIAARAGIRFIHDEVTGIDSTRKKVFLKTKPELDFDLASINVGIEPEIPKSLASHPWVIPLKPISSLLAQSSKVSSLNSSSKVLVLGAGAAGFEIAMLLAAKYRLSVTLLDRSIEPEPTTRPLLRKNLLQKSIELLLGEEITNSSADGSVTLASGNTLCVDLVIVATGAKPPLWFQKTDLKLNAQGFLNVDAELRASSLIFGAGDCVSIQDHTLPKSGVYAVRQGPILTHNIFQMLTPKPNLKRYSPQKTALALLTTGGNNVVAIKGSLTFQSTFFWKWKDSIDRRFMERFSLKAQKLASPMLCGGCGSKLGSQALKNVLREFSGQSLFQDAESLPGAPSTYASLDYLENLTSDPYLFGRIASEHALNDLYCKGLLPTSALSLAVLPKAEPHLLEADLRHLLNGAKAALSQANTKLIGGHTLQSSQMGFGLSVHAQSDSPPISKGPLRAGDHLILTKPLGVGTIMAAHRQGIAHGAWLQAAILSMCQSQAPLARILKEYSISACTDVTGFGLLGHLVEMLEHKPHVVTIDKASIPMISGANECISLGIESSIAPENGRFQKFVVAGTVPRIALDPQTSGGFLVAILPTQSEAFLKAVRGLGFIHAVRIGSVGEKLDSPQVKF